MIENNKSKKQLIEENEKLRQRIAQLESMETVGISSKQVGNHAEKNNRTNEEYYHTIVADFPGIIFKAYLKTWTPVYIHGAVKHITGYTEKELIKGNPRWDKVIHPEDLEEIIKSGDADRLRSLGGVKTDNEYRIIRKDGQIRWVHEINQNIYDDFDEPLFIQGVIFDITERKKAEEALQVAELKFRTVADFTYDWEYWVNPDGTIHYVSPSCKRISGYSADEFITNPALLYEIVIPDDREIWTQHNQLVASEPGLHEVQFRIRRNDGKTAWIEHACQPVNDEHGVNLGIRASNRDITDRKKAEEIFREGEKRFRSIYDQSPVGIELYDANAKLIDVNAACLNLFGVECVDEVKGFDLFEDLNLPSDAKEQLQKGEAVKYESIFDFDVVKQKSLYKTSKSGQYYIDCIITPLLGSEECITGYLIHVLDITERKRTEELLHLQSVVALNMSEGVYLVHVSNLIIVFANPKMEEMFGYGPGEMIGKHVSIINAPTGEDPVDTANVIKKSLEKNGFWKGDVRNIKKDGTEFWGQSSISTFNHPSYGDVYLSIQSDITERKRAEETLRKKEESLTRAQEIGKIGSWEWDLLTDKGTWSDQTYRIFGYEPGEVEITFEFLLKNMHPDDAERIAKEIEKAVVEKEPVKMVYRVYKKDKSLCTVQSRGEVILDTNGNPLGMLGVIQDITELKKVEEDLQATLSEKEDLLREVNHRVRNNLTSILGLLYKEKNKANDEMKSYKNLIQNLMGRIGSLATIHNLLSSSGWKPLNLGKLADEVIRAAFSGLSNSEKNKVEVKRSNVKVSSDQAHHLTLVLNELVTNSMKYALKKNSMVKINVSIVKDKDQIRLNYKDNGPGYPEEVLNGDFSKAGIGFDLIKGIISTNLKGEFTISNKDGAVISISFKKME